MKKFTIEIELSNGEYIFREFECEAKEQFNIAHQIIQEIEEHYDIAVQDWWFVK